MRETASVFCLVDSWLVQFIVKLRACAEDEGILIAKRNSLSAEGNDQPRCDEIAPAGPSGGSSFSLK